MPYHRKAHSITSTTYLLTRMSTRFLQWIKSVRGSTQSIQNAAATFHFCFRRRTVACLPVCIRDLRGYNRVMDTTILHQLPNDEKLRIIFELWDDLASSNAPIDLPAEVIGEAHRRRDEMIANRKSRLTKRNCGDA